MEMTDAALMLYGMLLKLGTVTISAAGEEAAVSGPTDSPGRPQHRSAEHRRGIGGAPADLASGRHGVGGLEAGSGGASN